jgi:hypothetical protein
LTDWYRSATLRQLETKDVRIPGSASLVVAAGKGRPGER